MQKQEKNKNNRGTAIRFEFRIYYFSHFSNFVLRASNF
jgi:hypothetical protein